MDIDYIITGEFNQLSQMMIPVMKESRFLSDEANVKSFTWYPITTEVQGVELELTNKPTDDELTFLCRDFSSLTIGVIKDGKVTKLITDEAIEVL
jgi:hypothetical protein